MVQAVRRADGKWVSEGSSDDDGTRHNNQTAQKTSRNPDYVPDSTDETKNVFQSEKYGKAKPTSDHINYGATNRTASDIITEARNQVDTQKQLAEKGYIKDPELDESKVIAETALKTNQAKQVEEQLRQERYVTIKKIKEQSQEKQPKPTTSNLISPNNSKKPIVNIDQDKPIDQTRTDKNDTQDLLMSFQQQIKKEPSRIESLKEGKKLLTSSSDLI